MARNELRDQTSAPEASSTDASSLSKDAIFGLLRNSRRRSALRWLAEANGQGTTSDLAEHIAAQENDVSVQAVTSQHRKRVYIALYQGHLPKMADFGVIEFDQSRGTVELTEAADDLWPYLEVTDEVDADSRAQRRRRAPSPIQRAIGTLRGIVST